LSRILNLKIESLGITIEDHESGVKVISIDDIDSSLQNGDIITEVNREVINNMNSFEELVNSFDEEMTLELAKRLEEDNYNTPFDGLKDWHLLRALAINRPELTTNYTHLLDQEPFDEN